MTVMWLPINLFVVPVSIHKIYFSDKTTVY